MMFVIRAGLALALIFPVTVASAMDFDSPDEPAFSSGGDDPDSEKMPEIEMEQAELRANRPFAMGFGLGESVPGAVLSLVTSRSLGEQRAMQMTVGVGNRRANLQTDGASSFSSKSTTRLVDGRYLWWLSREFPFAVDAGMTVAGIDGHVSDGDGASGGYRAYLAGIGGDFSYESVFENGIWLRWVILSGRYLKVLKGTYSDMSGERTRAVEKDLSGLKLVGVSNLTFGYSW